MAKGKKNVDLGLERTDDLESQPVTILEDGLTDPPFPNHLAPSFDGEIPAEKKAPNIIFIGDGEAPTGIYGSLNLKLPNPDIQQKGFYHPRAKEIIAALPRKYKRFQKLGDL